MTGNTLTEQAMKLLFTEARTHSAWLPEPVSADLLKKIYDLMKFGPTSANCSPLRIVFVKSREAKERLKPALSPGNLEKTMAAPVTAILAQDMKFYEHLPMLFPHADAKSWFAGNEPLIADTAARNSSLQGAYFIIAARAYGLDCGPMSGFDPEKLNQEFFKGTSFKANFICNLGFGDKTKLFPRSPRFKFDDICKIA
ncbi:MAG: malonic semialdehyde reductase [Alphaproteobacteria bacterium]|nr:malonic semialdehyde reductase [Alphaproteobacteria bacterium]